MKIAGWLLFFFLFACPVVMANSLAPCLDSLNCVSSLAENAKNKVAPLSYSGDLEIAKQRLLSIVTQLPRTVVVSNDGNYIHVTQASFVFRFIDDIEFMFDDVAKLIHVRSASRAGYLDFGVNRKRVINIRALFDHASE